MISAQNSATRILVGRLNLLREAILIFNAKRLQPNKGLTFCNQAVQVWAHSWGLHTFDGKLANEISETIRSSGQWQTATPQRAIEAATGCRLVIAHIQENPHGHVAAVMPSKVIAHHETFWGDVPVLSMGRTPLIGARCSRAFKYAPDFHIFADPDRMFPWGK